jgi:hypothetical protein
MTILKSPLGGLNQTHSSSHRISGEANGPRRQVRDAAESGSEASPFCSVLDGCEEHNEAQLASGSPTPALSLAGARTAGEGHGPHLPGRVAAPGMDATATYFETDLEGPKDKATEWLIDESRGGPPVREIGRAGTSQRLAGENATLGVVEARLRPPVALSAATASPEARSRLFALAREGSRHAVTEVALVAHGRAIRQTDATEENHEAGFGFAGGARDAGLGLLSGQLQGGHAKPAQGLGTDGTKRAGSKAEEARIAGGARASMPAVGPDEKLEPEGKTLLARALSGELPDSESGRGLPGSSADSVRAVRLETHRLDTGEPATVFRQLAQSLQSAKAAGAGAEFAEQPGSHPSIRSASVHSARDPGPLKILHVQLRPAELGTVTIRLDLHNSELRVRLTADSGRVAGVLRRDAGTLLAMLRNAGIDVDPASVEVFEAVPELSGDAGAGSAAGGDGGSRASGAGGREASRPAGMRRDETDVQPEGSTGNADEQVRDGPLWRPAPRYI